MKLILLCAMTLSFCWRPAFAAKDFPGNSVFHLEGEWLNHEGKPSQLRDLQGRVSAIAMVYTSCQYACPMIVEELKKVREKVSPKNLSKVNFVLLSMDPQRDTPAVLKTFASKRSLDLSAWRLLTPKSERLIREYSAIVGANYKKTGKDFVHSNLITILGADGVIELSKANLGQQINEAAAAIDRLTSGLPAQ